MSSEFEIDMDLLTDDSNTKHSDFSPRNTLWNLIRVELAGKRGTLRVDEVERGRLKLERNEWP
jgi:hypothetical protein